MSKAKGPILDVPKHGVTGYHDGCRCDVCVADNYAAQKAWRAKVRAAPTPDRVHGTVNGAKIYGCDCDPCKTAARTDAARQRARRRRAVVLAAAGLPHDWDGPIL